jgi:hypothetical protein
MPKREREASLAAKIKPLMAMGLGVKQIAGRLGKSESRIYRIRRSLLVKFKFSCCAACGRPLESGLVGTTVPCENVKPAES